VGKDVDWDKEDAIPINLCVPDNAGVSRAKKCQIAGETGKFPGSVLSLSQAPDRVPFSNSPHLRPCFIFPKALAVRINNLLLFQNLVLSTVRKIFGLLTRGRWLRSHGSVSRKT
jgi:hypothetical protein